LDAQLVGGPGWVSSDRFDIIAKGEGEFQPIGTPNPQADPMRLQLMLRGLLAERFKLVLRSEWRDLPVYALVGARQDGKSGPRLQPSTTDCAARMAAMRAGQPPAPPLAGFPVACGMRVNPGGIAAGDVTIDQIVGGLSNVLQRIVLNRTNLTGRYNVDLSWTPEQMPRQSLNPDAPPAIDLSGPSIFTAVQEQLGLKLESTKAPIDVMVIDRVEQPTPD
jgi:uncharacterized protein (TIGR03435 family)